MIAVNALMRREFFPYSDFLLHDMGLALDSAVALAGARRTEYRTTPLWGWRFRKSGMLHDGRAWSTAQAIGMHGGEASAARDAYRALSSGERGFIKKFLVSL